MLNVSTDVGGYDSQYMEVSGPFGGQFWTKKESKGAHMKEDKCGGSKMCEHIRKKLILLCMGCIRSREEN